MTANRCHCTLVRVFLFLSIPLWAQAGDAPEAAPRLSLPIQCDMGRDCHIQNYVDDDPGPGFRDYACGSLGYDGHKGTDFRLPNLEWMERGVPVLAAAAGRVRAVRDEMPDISIREPGQLRRVKNREAGNSVAIVHGGGWETQYAHMRLGSIRVKPGDRVAKGQVIGLVGLSGKTEFPHVHLSVRYKGRTVDPFKGLEPDDDCGPGRAALWSEETLRRLPYTPTGLLQAGFYDDRPSTEVIDSGRALHYRPTADAKAIVFWVDLFGVHEGDREQFRLTGPGGGLLAQRQGDIPRGKVHWISYIGKRRAFSDWPAGRYRAEYRLLRPDEGGERREVLKVVRSFSIGEQ